MCQYANVPICQCANMPMCQYANYLHTVAVGKLSQLKLTPDS